MSIFIKFLPVASLLSTLAFAQASTDSQVPSITTQESHHSVLMVTIVAIIIGLVLATLLGYFCYYMAASSNIRAKEAKSTSSVNGHIPATNSRHDLYKHDSPQRDPGTDQWYNDAVENYEDFLKANSTVKSISVYFENEKDKLALVRARDTHQ